MQEENKQQPLETSNTLSSVPPVQASEPVVIQDNQGYTVMPPSLPKKKHHLLVLILLLVIVIAAASIYYIWYKKDTNTTAQSTSGTTVASAPQLCSVVYGYLTCTDANGKNQVRYNLPLLDGMQINSLSANASQSEFLAYTSGNSVTGSQLWLLNSKLGLVKQITFPSSYSDPNTPTLSNDGKSIFLELDTSSGNVREIYQYTIATGKLVRLTPPPVNGQQYSDASIPQQTQDGHILYSYFNGSDWVPYIMNSNGTDKKPLPGITFPASAINNFGYDTSTNTVYVAYDVSNTNGSPDQSKIAYGNLAQLLHGGTATVVSLGAVDFSSPAVMTRISSSSIAIDDNVYSLTTGKQTEELPTFSEGDPVGWLNTASFTRSSQQTVQPNDYIDGLATTTADFKTFMEQFYKTQDAACVADGVPQGSSQPTTPLGVDITINGEVRDEFATFGWNCSPYGDPVGATYIKTNGVWTEVKALESDDYLACSAVNQYKFTKVLIPQCIDSNNNTVANTNP